MKLGLSERNFFDSPLKKIIRMIEIHNKIQSAEQMDEYGTEIREIQSMREIEGWENG